MNVHKAGNCVKIITHKKEKVVFSFQPKDTLEVEGLIKGLWALNDAWYSKGLKSNTITGIEGQLNNQQSLQILPSKLYVTILLLKERFPTSKCQPWQTQ